VTLFTFTGCTLGTRTSSASGANPSTRRGKSQRFRRRAERRGARRFSLLRSHLYRFPQQQRIHKVQRVKFSLGRSGVPCGTV
jgi:hypothetical protein